MPTQRVALSDGNELVLERFGTPGARPLLLLHGLSQQRFFWLPTIGALLHGGADLDIVSADLRGHGDSDTPADADYSIRRCALDVREAVDALGWTDPVIVGHSWGASVALAASALGPAAAVVLIDGGLRPLAALGERAEVLARLEPPALGLPEDELWALIGSGPLGPYLDDDARAALRPTFGADPGGRLRTRIGLERHMRVLAGLYDYDPLADLGRATLWAVACGDAEPDPAVAAIALLQRWQGAIHDVPLQWPHLVAGLLRTAVDEAAREGTR